MYVNVTPAGVIDFSAEDGHDLDFGGMPAGSVSRRSIVIDQGNNPTALVHITPCGEIAGWISMNRSVLLLGSPASVEVTVDLPDDAVIGEYSGWVTFKYRYYAIPGF